MSDITAVVLSIGERYRERAIASVRRQTLPAADLVEVRDVSPFHRALNEGAGRVRTSFFVQVDADLVLDDACFAVLRAGMDDRFGMVSGLVRDPIVGRSVGVRLYRTQCFEHISIGDTISPDRDFERDLRAHGWGRLFVLRYTDLPRPSWHTVGDHLPDYTTRYTFWKFVLEGVRARYRRGEGRVALMFGRLAASRHEAANLALIGLAHGLFLGEQRDLLRPYPRSDEVELLESLLATTGGVPGAACGEDESGSDRQRFLRASAQGNRDRDAGAGAAFLARLDALRRRRGRAAWFTVMGLCHGLLHRPGHGLAAEAAYQMLPELLEHGEPW